MLGQTVSHYRILSKLGEGGMGVVYLAEDILLERRVAIKTLNVEPGKQHYRQRFLREARAVSALHHPNIAVVHAYGETPDGKPFIVMELVEGDTLAELLNRGGLATSRVLNIIEEVTKALGEAHRLGIIHRDIKPSNVIINKRGEVKVLDFGLAKNISDGTEEDAQSRAFLATQTREGVIVGTPMYLSPEQALGLPVDARSDLFSLGAVLYECVTGQPAFPGRSAAEVCAKVIRDDPPAPSQFNAEVTPDLERVILRALAKKAEDRYQSADEMRAALRAACTALPSAVDGITPQHVKRRETGYTSTLQKVSAVLRRPRTMTAAFLTTFTFAIVIAYAFWPSGTTELDRPSVEALRLYEKGVEALHDGNYFTASKIFEEAIRLDNGYVLAHARLGEAWSALDYADEAKEELIQAGRLVSDRTILPPTERLYLQGITSTILREYPQAIATYREIERQASERERPAVLIDLGRAYENAEDMKLAVESYQAAVSINPQSAAAFLRLGVAYGRLEKRSDAFAAFDEAARLYRTISNDEGVAEVHYQRGSLLAQEGKAAEARAELLQALEMSRPFANNFTIIRALLRLSGITYFEGQTISAKQYASEALEAARVNGLENLSTEGLIDLGDILFVRREYDQAEGHYKQALEIARRFKGLRNEAKAALSLGRLYVQKEENLEEALNYIERSLMFFRQGGHRKEMSLAVLLRGRARILKGDYDTALQEFDAELRAAEQSGNAAIAASLHREIGDLLAERELYPQALPHYEQSFATNNAQGNRLHAGYALLDKADVLWRLGRYPEADYSLQNIPLVIEELDSEYKQVLEVRRKLVDARVALSQLRPEAAESISRDVLLPSGQRYKRTVIEATGTLGLAQSLRGAKRDGKMSCRAAVKMAEQAGDPQLLSSATLILAEVTLEDGDPRGALALVRKVLDALVKAGRRESAWRAWLIATRANLSLKDYVEARECLDNASLALKEIERAWGEEAFASYTTRSDIRRYLNHLKDAAAALSGG